MSKEINDQAVNSENIDVEKNILKDQLARLTADFENYKKRIIRERASLEEVAKKDVIEDLLAIIKDIDLAYLELQKAPAEVKNWLVGIELIYKSFHDFLIQQNVKEIETKDFDPNLHEALNQVPATEDQPSGTIITVYEKGYSLNGNLIRAAKVCVAQ